MRLSVKMKLTLWFAAMMAVMAVIVVILVSMVTANNNAQGSRLLLTNLVEQNIDEIEYDKGEIDIDDDFVNYRGGVYVLAYDADGNRLTGYSPYGDFSGEPFEDQSLREVASDGETYFLYDRLADSGEGTIWLRGVTEDSQGKGLSDTARALLVTMPVWILLASAGGYLLARRSMKPVQAITETAEEITESGDLSKRIELEKRRDEFHRLGAVFNRMMERLERSFEAERQFTSDASHELRTPVSVILAQCEYAIEDAKSEEELCEAIEAIQRQGYRMNRLIESLLSFTRLEQGTEKPDFVKTDVSALLTELCAEQEEAGEKGITLSTRIQPGIYVKTDAVLFSRMAVNLIRNAYRYGKENGHILVSLSQAEGEMILQVADDGIGIAGSELPLVWNRFYRADRARTSGAGLGLGLAMVKQIAELHGGNVSVKSILHVGSEFSVTLKSCGQGGSAAEDIS